MVRIKNHSHIVLKTALLLVPCLGRKIRVVNSCGSTVWPGMFTGGGNAPMQQTGWELPSLRYTEFEVADDWTAGRIWARTGCTVQDGKFQCLTGSCGQGNGGDLSCQVTNEPPATLAEFTLAKEGEDHYDISLVDGFNVPMVIQVSLPECQDPSCPTNINPMCPPLLRTSIDQEGKNLGCIAACNAGFGQEKWGNRACCSGGYNDPNLCAICGVDYYSLFKDNCETSYAYAYDEKSKTALWTCPASVSKGKLADYTIEFCPNKTDYVGSHEAGTQYLSATATCSNKATWFDHTFEVKPSPTQTATIGTLKVVATVAPGVDGAAAVENGASSVFSSSSVIASGSSGAQLPTSSSSSTVSGLKNGTYSRPGPTIGSDGRVTQVLEVIDGTTIMEVHSTESRIPAAAFESHQGGQWLKGIPVQHQRKRKLGHGFGDSW